MIKIFHVPHSRSVRVIWLMEELQEPYELETIAFPTDDAFRSLSPTASVPTIVDGDIVMGESIAILQYLTGRRLQKSMEMKITVGPNPDPAAYAEHLQFLHLGEASLMARRRISRQTLPPSSVNSGLLRAWVLWKGVWRMGVPGSPVRTLPLRISRLVMPWAMPATANSTRLSALRQQPISTAFRPARPISARPGANGPG